MSFFLTQRQMNDRSKTVTRRLGSSDITVGELRRPIVKGQGIPKGGKVEYLPCGPVRVVDVRREALVAMLEEPYGSQEAAKEGFPHMTGAEFVAMFAKHNTKNRIDVDVNRIEFGFEEPARG